MNVSDAAYATVHDYPGGSEALAPRMGMSAAVLRNKVNPNNDRNQLTLAEAERMMALTGDRRILLALADEQGCGVSLLEASDHAGTIDTLSLKTMMASGDLARTITEALDDGVITEREMRQIEAAGMTSQATVAMLVRKLRAQASVRPRSEG